MENSMKTIRGLFIPPQAEEYEHDKKVKFLHTTLWVLFVAMLIFGYLNSDPIVGPTAQAMFLASGISLVGLFLNSIGKYYWAAILMTVIVIFVNYFNLHEGVSLADSGIAAFPIIIIFSGFLFGRRAIIPITVINIGSVMLLVYFERTGVITPPVLTSDERIIVLTVLIIITAILLRVIMDNWENSLERAKYSEGQLRIALEEVRKTRDRLELHVEERTSDLQQANQELEAFAYSVSHDLRAPLRGISGFSRILVDEFADQLDQEGIGYLERIMVSGSRMNDLIDDMLLLSQVGRSGLTPKEINICDIAQQVFNKLYGGDQVGNVLFKTNECPPAKADPNLSEILLTNLISNSIKFTKDKSEAEIEFGHLDNDGHTVYYLRDNGVGFDMNYADKIFMPFQRLHGQDQYEGTGIGLAIVHRIVSRHNGEIWVESELGKGTTVFFKFG
jgi:signal transduction histidine kinase